MIARVEIWGDLNFSNNVKKGRGRLCLPLPLFGIISPETIPDSNREPP